MAKTATSKLDLVKEHKSEYVSPKKPALVEVGSAQYLTITGQGEPGGEVFSEKLGALYAIAFTAKMASKAAGCDYKVCPLEGLWWGSDDKTGFADQPRATWNWKLLIRTPDSISRTDVERAAAAAREKGKPAEVAEVQLEQMVEGRCVQMLHVGSYECENATIAEMLSFVAEQSLSVHGLHHEIYLSDPRRVAPDKLRTILRFPVR